jgi:hypothetical protein
MVSLLFVQLARECRLKAEKLIEEGGDFAEVCYVSIPLPVLPFFVFLNSSALSSHLFDLLSFLCGRL